MRKISFKALSLFIMLQAFIFYTVKSWLLFDTQSTLEMVLLFWIETVVLNVIFYRMLIYFFPFPDGDIPENSKSEFVWMIYTCFWLTYFHPIRNLNLVPVYLTPLTNKILGGKMHLDSYNSGTILDPHLVIIGRQSFIGNRAMLIPHYQEGKKFGHNKIIIGKDVTIGACSVILPGVIIEDGAIVGALSLVTKNTHIKAGEVWAGAPARRIKPAPQLKVTGAS